MGDRMRIVIAVEEFNPSKGYLEYYLARELRKLGHKVYIFTFGCGKDAARTMLNEGFEVINVPYFAVIHGYHLPSFKGIVYILNFNKAEKPNIIHCEPLDSPLSLIFIMCAGIFKYKIVGSIITQLNLVFSPWNIKKKLLFSFSKIIVTHFVKKRSEIVFAKTKELARLISQSYNMSQNKFRIIPLGCDPELFKFDLTERFVLRNKLGLCESDVVIVYSGKLDRSKRLDLLVKALSPIISKNSRVKLLIIGQGELSYVEYLRKLISDFQISNNVVFHPWVDRTQLPSFYSASDIGVWPGLSSISIVEAASVGLPLIIVKVPVETYAVDNNNGFAFELDNMVELQEYLRRLIDDEELRREMGRRSRCLVEQRLNWRYIAVQYVNAYSHALKN